jgi:hypothetical protein
VGYKKGDKVLLISGTTELTVSRQEVDSGANNKVKLKGSNEEFGHNGRHRNNRSDLNIVPVPPSCDPQQSSSSFLRGAKTVGEIQMSQDAIAKLLEGVGQ